MSSQNDLRAIKRYVTTHDAAGRSVFSETVHEDPPPVASPIPAHMSFCYATQNFPVEIENENDIERYKQFIAEPPGIVVSNGTTARIVDAPPGYTSVMHRTISVNYNFIIEGEIELILDSGEKRLMKPGDTLVQRAINHAWRNPSDTKWCRMAAVTFPAAVSGLKESGTEAILHSGSTSEESAAIH
jgi:quercetin dioxygenase-like cupin family protein